MTRAKLTTTRNFRDRLGAETSHLLRSCPRENASERARPAQQLRLVVRGFRFFVLLGDSTFVGLKQFWVVAGAIRAVPYGAARFLMFIRASGGVSGGANFAGSWPRVEPSMDLPAELAE